MAYEDQQPEFPVGDNSKKSSRFLPRYFRTSTNEKLVSSTVDQLFSTGAVEKINAFIGRKNAKANINNSTYLTEINSIRANYQLDPSINIKDDLDNVVFHKDYVDYIGQLNTFNSNTINHSQLNEQEIYSWNPHIDFDKFTNFREYYWLPNGPQTVTISGNQQGVISTYKVGVVDEGDNFAYLFTPNNLTRNPLLTLYRGQTYRFEINTPGHPFALAISRQFLPGLTFEDSVTNASTLYNEGVTTTNADSDGYVETGVIEFTVPANAPNELYYISKEDINTSGLFNIADIEENTTLNVENELLGKRYYTTSNGWSLSNGMKISFAGNIIPEKYSSGEFYVEGVGKEIVLISVEDLTTADLLADDEQIPFDAFGFDRLPWSTSIGYPATKDYIVSNRSSKDKNPWARYNRWFHIDVITKSAEINKQEYALPENSRGKRPIIEFAPGIKMWHNGTTCKDPIDLIDDWTTDIFSIIEGSQGYNIDNIDLVDGMRILFTNDTDPLVNNKIYKVEFIKFQNSKQIALKEELDALPNENDIVLIKNGNINAGKQYFFNGESWKKSQDKTAINQAPLFDLFDKTDISYGDSYYESSDFFGNKIFAYKQGTGTNDTELGFPISYKNINNVGDIVFEFDLLKQNNTYIINDETIDIPSNQGFVKIIDSYTGEISFENAWKKHVEKSNQAVILDFQGSQQTNNFAVNCFDKSATISDLKIKVFTNRSFLKENIDYTLTTNPKQQVLIVLNNNISENDRLIIKCYSSASKNENGYYETAYNLERNPNNLDVTEFTIGEVNDHVQTIVENIDNFSGIHPGVGNLRDLGNIEIYGDRFVQHSGPIGLALYHLTSKDYNVVNSLKFALKEYSKFKREFLRIATYDGYNNTDVKHVDYLLEQFALNKTRNDAFYDSDTVPFGGKNIIEYTVLDSGNPYYPLTSAFNLNELSSKSVLIYKNGTQLIYEKEYTFTEEGFVYIYSVEIDDKIEIHEYETTDGCFIPPTPSKLGLYPLYEPEIYIDNTYSTPTKVVIGHDGSKTIAFNDFRDDLLLELEKRIFNNVKTRYNSNNFNLFNFIPGRYRNTGLNQTDINNIMIADFINWTNVAQVYDFNVNKYSDINDSFTYNYKSSSDIDGKKLEGFWRAVYKNAYDTDTPNLNPWEMLGFSIQPTWWETVYGPAPYTSNNLLLWKDLEAGIIREPNTPVVKNIKFARPNLLKQIPVDEHGRIRSPFQTGFSKDFSFSNQIGYSFEFGDQGPAETAWRRSSEYPFSLLNAILLLRPAQIFGLAYDYSKISKNLAGNIVYNHKTLISTTNIDFDSKSSGLLNYIKGYIDYNNMSYESYKEYVKSINFNLSFRLAGFSDKDKINLVLDSKTPNSSGDIFTPQENYNLFLKTSSPYEVVTYSGVVIEKVPTGYKINGYDRYNPTFPYYSALETNSDPFVTVGGISETFSNWNAEKLYVTGGIVRYDNNYYRVNETHTSGNSFDSTKFSKLSNLPTVGGRTARFSKRFSSTLSYLQYGTVFTTYQQVIDFLLGYDQYLKSVGFIFDYNNAKYGIVENFRLSAKEFLFWTTQNWGENSIISLSPSANKIQFKRDFYLPDSLYDSIFDYEVLDQDGKLLSNDFVNLVRDTDNSFSLASNDDNVGVYFIRLFLVQKEHCIVIDNDTVFADTIYNETSGYRQERIKVTGYRTANWSGTLNIPGFVFDEPKVTKWKSYKDYIIGDAVQYKDKYYTSIVSHTSDEFFNNKNWSTLSEKPTNQLIPNFDYRASQFADFYDLDTDNFDTEQQRLAQHLIGYQKREYLKNIINDDISQYKFYQGMIQDKGTKNVLTKLFDKLSSADQDSIEFFEEWAIRAGQYGATDSFDEYEITIDESKYKLTPQPFELVKSVDNTRTDFIYQIAPTDLQVKPANYNQQIFEFENYEEITKTAGYIAPAQIDFITPNLNQLLGFDINLVKQGQFVWVTDDGLDWNVYEFAKKEYQVEKIEKTLTGFKAIFDINHDLQSGDIIGLTNVATELDGFRQVIYTGYKEVEFYTEDNISEEGIDLSDSSKGIVIKVAPRRFENIDAYNNVLNVNDVSVGNRAWIDNLGNDKWSVLENTPVYDVEDIIVNPQTGLKTNFGDSIAVDQTNTRLAIGDPNSNGRVIVYNRIGENGDFSSTENYSAETSIIGNNSEFGYSVSMSSNGEYLFVGAPNAANLLTRYKGNIVPGTSYSAGEIINDRGTLWKAKVDIDGSDTSTVNKQSQDWERANIISVDEDGSPTASIRGAVCVYKKAEVGPTYELETTILSPIPTAGERFGRIVKCRKDTDGILRLYVASDAASGRIYFFDNDTVDGAWKFSRDDNFRGTFSGAENYIQGEIVYYNNTDGDTGDSNLYRAKKDISAQAFNLNNWELLDQFVDYKGYVPPQSELLNEESDNLGVAGGYNIATDFDLSTNGEVLVLNGEDTLNTNKVSVYRRENNRYAYYETIETADLSEEFGSNIAISANGNAIAVSAIRNNDKGTSFGSVYVYRYTGNEYALNQTLYPPTGAEGELFGIDLNFSEDNLIVASANGDRSVPTLFDQTIIRVDDTSFDNNTTKFFNKFEDSGTIYIFQNFNNNYLYAEELDWNYDTSLSSKPVILTNFNHIYISYPRLEYTADFGVVINLKREKGTYSWKKLSEQIDTPNINKIKRAFLFDKKTNDILTFLDVIDPIQGKIAGPADEVIDLKLAFDPASYSVDVTTTNKGDYWAAEYVGKYWWNTESTKWYNPYQGNAENQTSFWNKLVPSSKTEVFEWVESDYLPSEWDELADTNDGVIEGISGVSKYGDFKYSIGRKYNAITETFETKYYFWVRNKKLLSNENKKISSNDAEQLIKDPQSAGYVFMSALSTNKFALHNVGSFIKDKDVALHIDVYKGKINDRNIHTEYKLLSEGLAGSNPPASFIEKWIDSLVGYDKNLRPVPDTQLGETKKYGIETRPRQSLFRNGLEALKQTIERTNLILKQQIITDFKDITDLSKQDQIPRILEGKFDISVDTINDIQTVGAANVKRAVLIPTIENGKLISVKIQNQGYGYKSAPTVTITGTGTDAEVTTTIDNFGRVSSVTIVESGKNYSLIDLQVRPFSLLVENDAELNGKWAIYEYDYAGNFERVKYQKWNVENFWSYVDWYETDYDENTAIDYLIDGSYQLNSLNDRIGDIVKIKDVGAGGWLLLQKIDIQPEVDYTVNYKTIGRQNGTIEFSSKLYQNTNFGFDKIGFDNLVYDTEPVNERRIILETIKNKIFVEDLEIKFNDILFTGIRYALYEQQTVDWIFKTSFLTAKHNLGVLDQRINFKSDNLDSYKDFINEVKPYSSKIREYISAYENLENSQTMISDFDLPPRYDNIQNKIVTETVKFYNERVVGDREFIETYPQKNWLDNYKFKIQELVIYNQGHGLNSQPVITISGGNGPTITGKGYRTGDKLTSIDIDYSDALYTSQPNIEINGSYDDDYEIPRIIAVLGDSPVRSTHMIMKFDRVSGNFVFTDLKTVETFTGTGAQKTFNTKWPLDLRKSRISITVNGNDVLYTDFETSNIKNTSKTYDRTLGQIVFETAPANNAVIEITYYKDSAMLSAADRINAYYNPSSGMPGITKNEDGTTNLGQLMTGVNYDGVSLESVDFTTEQGFDIGGFGIIPWDIFSQTDDEIFTLDGSTLVLTLSKPLEDGVAYNIYKNNMRIDDPNFDSSSAITNKNALLNTVYGDGVTDEILIDNEVPTAAGDIFIVRKETSDGSFEPADNVLDTELTGGGFNNTARGLNSGEITVDGDGFVTPITSAGPEEVVPGQIVDTLDIQVKHKPADGQGIKTSYIYKTKGNILSYSIDVLPQSQQAIIVNLNGNKVDIDSYTVDYENNQLVFEDDSTIQDDQDLHIIVVGNNGDDILESDTFIGDGNTKIFVTGIKFTNPISSFVTINGVVQQVGLNYEIFETDSSYKQENCAALRFSKTPAAGEVIGFSLYNNDTKSFSEIMIDKSFVGDGVNYVYNFGENNMPYTAKPFTHKMLVKQGDKFLNAGYNIRHIVTNDRVYGIQEWQFEQPTKISNDDVVVILNNSVITDTKDYRWDAINSRIEFLNPNIGNVGDILEIYILGNGEYYFIDTVVDLVDMDDSTKLGVLHNEGDLISFVMEDSTQIFATVKSSEETDNGVRLTLNGYFKELKVKSAENDVPLELTGVKSASYPLAVRIDNVTFIESENLTFKKVPDVGERVEIITFSEHDVNNFDRLSFEVLYTPVISSSSDEYNTAIQLTNGRIKLNQPAAGVNYVWVIQDNKLLRPSVDYNLMSNNTVVNLFNKPANNEVVEIIQFAASVTSEKYGFRIFKDMLNRVHYKRLNETSVFKLGQPLNYFDQYITLEDTTGIPIPNRTTGKPGVLFIEGERIEYYVVEGNLLRQIRRGTLGTGVKTQYLAGTKLQDQGETETIPYKDKDIQQIFVSDGSTNTYNLDFDILNYNEIEVIVGGKKLRKPATQEFTVFDPLIDQDSPEGDNVVQPEFTIDAENDTIILRDDVPTGVRIVIQRKQGNIWTNDLSTSDSKIARFIRAGTIKLSK